MLPRKRGERSSNPMLPVPCHVGERSLSSDSSAASSSSSSWTSSSAASGMKVLSASSLLSSSTSKMSSASASSLARGIGTKARPSTARKLPTLTMSAKARKRWSLISGKKKKENKIKGETIAETVQAKASTIHPNCFLFFFLHISLFWQFFVYADTKAWFEASWGTCTGEKLRKFGLKSDQRTKAGGSVEYSLEADNFFFTKSHNNRQCQRVVTISTPDRQAKGDPSVGFYFLLLLRNRRSVCFHLKRPPGKILKPYAFFATTIRQSSDCRLTCCLRQLPARKTDL